MQSFKLPNCQNAKEYYISPEGLQQMISRKIDPQFSARNIVWSDDFRNQMPIKMGNSGISSVPPTTLIEQFQRVVRQNGDRKALSVKRQGKWQTLNYKEYYQECINFGKALLAFKFSQFTGVNIIGFNSPEWFISFFGSLFARCLPIGIYTTNNQSACEYVATHSQSKIVVSENRQYAEKYISLLKQGKIDLIIIYDPSFTKSEFDGKIISWNKFMGESKVIDDRFILQRMASVRPGHCCTLVYTSGTTGMPKGVMLSHDNYTWTKKATEQLRNSKAMFKRDPSQIWKILSYLPLSHVAGQFSDMVSGLLDGSHVYFAAPDALQGTLVQTLQEVRPNIFFSVPRVWEKIYQKMMQIAKQNGFLKSKIATWAKSIGQQGSIKEARGQQTSFQFKLAKKLVYNNVKKALGLDECRFFFFGAAPLDPQIRAYFLSLNFFLINGYGMSESTGPQNLSDEYSLDISTPEGFRQVGRPMPGTDMMICKENQKDEDGEICYRGRNTFMGYYKNALETAKTIDKNGFLHSGDNGKLTKGNILFITGRAKQLIITGGGQNIPPVLIENQIKAQLPIVANVMVVGDMRKYLICLIAIKEDPPASGKIESLAKDYFANKNCNVNTISQALQNPKVKAIIKDGLDRANKKAISRAQFVQDFMILSEDFSVDNGLLTPTLKLKRKEVIKKYEVEIEKMYNQAKL